IAQYAGHVPFEHTLLPVMRLCIRRCPVSPIFVALLICIGFAERSSAQLILSGNENKIDLTSGAPPVIPGETGRISFRYSISRCFLPKCSSELKFQECRHHYGRRRDTPL